MGLQARAVPLLLFALLVLSLLFALSDRDGYEGDDLNSIVPMFHLEAAKQEQLLIYRYAWQPLSYELGAGVFRATAKPAAIFVLAPIAGALSLVLLLLLTWRDGASFATSLVAILAVPELWFSGLYYNSTIVGLPFALASLALLRMQRGAGITMIAGVLAGSAVLIRVDFALVCPALVLVAWLGGRSIARPAIFVVSVAFALALAWWAGLMDIERVITIHRDSSAEIAAKAAMPGWDMRTKLGVLSVLLSPVGWVVLLLGGPMVACQVLRRDPVSGPLGMLAALPMVLPLMNALSAKYFLPLAIFVVPFLAQCLSAIEQQMPARLRRLPLALAGAGTVLLLVVSFSVLGKPPFVHIAAYPTRTVGTHDGERSYGGYLWLAYALDRSAPRIEPQLVGQSILRDFMETTGPDIVVVGDENYFSRGGIGWRHLQLALEQEAVRGRLVAARQIRFEREGRRLTLVRDLDPDVLGKLERGRGLRVIDLRSTD